jgi:Lrp/AsnC family leucine-responsive transcriptional regulator
MPALSEDDSVSISMSESDTVIEVKLRFPFDWSHHLDRIDRELIALLQEDATTPYASLGAAVGLSTAATHDRVRKLRETGTVRRTTVDIDPLALGHNALAFVLIDAKVWMGDSGAAFSSIASIEEAHIIAGKASVLVKVRTTDSRQLQKTLRQIYEIAGVTGTEAVVVLETLFERDLDPRQPDD